MKDPPPSDDCSVTIHLFACGDGDTVVLCLPDNRNVLVDCYLPQRPGTFQRFQQFLAARNIDSFDLVVLTHPDEDHFTGMARVVREYSRDDGTTRFIDGGMNDKELLAYFKNRVGEKGLRKLFDTIDELSLDGSLRWEYVGRNYCPIVPRGLEDSVQFVPIGPDHVRQRRAARGAMERLAAGKKVYSKPNDYSVVLVLRLSHEKQTRNLLLAGDAEQAGLRDALDFWEERSRTEGAATEFAVVKIPHHGSATSGSPRLCLLRDKTVGEAVAAVSAGFRFGPIPDSEVLRSYLESGWTVLATSTRHTSQPGQRSFAFEVAGRKVDLVVEEHDIEITMQCPGETRWHPPESRIVIGDLEGRYRSAERPEGTSD